MTLVPVILIEITTGLTKVCYDILKLKKQKASSSRQLNHCVCQPHFVQDGPSVLEFKELRHPYVTPRNPVKFRFRTPEAEKKTKEEADGKKAEAVLWLWNFGFVSLPGSWDDKIDSTLNLEYIINRGRCNLYMHKRINEMK
ncbi:hypothetical protein RhiirA1_399498 [Rhizophagus irregularis]|uniref:Uncharacterized protein n=1 Tax=Rhizophagus irregularis TaxID=588596 RepID=A0A2I1F9G6_9GLOM|nr:hypothetical protein RhiirA1_399498 [Rhizophagus irregularis]PKY31022.1 hypothetical protein RhiirB3_475044 [Rhizophagus irregularis]